VRHHSLPAQSTMDRITILNRLAQVRRHVAEADRHIARQRDVIAQRERDGHDTSAAKKLLDRFEELYRMHVDGRDRLEKELVEPSK
jgi:hypothetical protein